MIFKSRAERPPALSRPKTLLLLASLTACPAACLPLRFPLIAEEPVQKPVQKPVEVLATGVFATALQSLAPAFEAAKRHNNSGVDRQRR